MSSSFEYNINNWMNIEKNNIHKSNSNCSSDTDSEEEEDNQFLLDFIFNKSKFENANG
jgi:hypothetical protein